MKIAYDIELMRPACVIVAASMGADSDLAHWFDTQDWLLAPTPNMKVYPVTEDQVDQLVVMTREKREKNEEHHSVEL